MESVMVALEVVEGCDFMKAKDNIIVDDLFDFQRISLEKIFKNNKNNIVMPREEIAHFSVLFNINDLPIKLDKGNR